MFRASYLVDCHDDLMFTGAVVHHRNTTLLLVFSQNVFAHGKASGKIDFYGDASRGRGELCQRPTAGANMHYAYQNYTQLCE